MILSATKPLLVTYQVGGLGSHRLEISQQGLVVVRDGPSSQWLVAATQLTPAELGVLTTLIDNPNLISPPTPTATLPSDPIVDDGNTDRYIIINSKRNIIITLTGVPDTLWPAPLRELYTFLSAMEQRTLAHYTFPSRLFTYVYAGPARTYVMYVDVQGGVSFAGDELPVGQLPAGQFAELKALFEQATSSGEVFYQGYSAPITAQATIEDVPGNERIWVVSGAHVPASVQRLLEELAAIYTQVAR